MATSPKYDANGWQEPTAELCFVQRELEVNRQKERDAQALIEMYAEREQRLLERLQRRPL